MKKIVIAVASVFLASGCATNTQGENTGLGALIGAAAGCAAFELMGKKCLDGAIIGVAVGAVVGWNYESKKVATAETVNEEARKAGVSVPNNKIVLESYSIAPTTNTVKAGDTVISQSDIKLIGRSNRAPDVTETLTLADPQGKEYKPQTAKVAAVDGAGRYTTTGRFKFPEGSQQGRYTVKSALSLDGNIVANKSYAIQVAYIDGSKIIQVATIE